MSLCKVTQHWPLRTQITVSCVSVLFLWPIYPLTVLVLCRLLISNMERKQAFHSQPVQSFFWGLAVTDVVVIDFEKQLSSAAQLMYAHTVLVSGIHSSSVWVCAHNLIIIRKNIEVDSRCWGEYMHCVTARFKDGRQQQKKYIYKEENKSAEVTKDLHD